MAHLPEDILREIFEFFFFFFFFDDDGYRAILAESYDEYRRLQQEQERLLTRGSFVKSLAASIARMPGARTLAFLDEADLSI